MKKVVLIACAAKNGTMPAAAVDLYQSQLFNRSIEYARTLNPDQILILSAKHGLVSQEQVIEPYDVSLTSMTVQQRKAWTKRVMTQLKSTVKVKDTEFVVLAGKHYREFLLPLLPHANAPLAGLGIGEQLHWLKTLAA